MVPLTRSSSNGLHSPKSREPARLAATTQNPSWAIRASCVLPLFHLPLLRGDLNNSWFNLGSQGQCASLIIFGSGKRGFLKTGT